MGRRPTAGAQASEELLFEELERKLRLWPDSAAELREVVRNLARRVDASRGGAWVLHRHFRRLVSAIDRSTFCGTTRGEVGYSQEQVDNFTEFLSKASVRSPDVLVAEFSDEYEVGLSNEHDEDHDWVMVQDSRPAPALAAGAPAHTGDAPDDNGTIASAQEKLLPGHVLSAEEANAPSWPQRPLKPEEMDEVLQQLLAPKYESLWEPQVLAREPASAAARMEAAKARVKSLFCEVDACLSGRKEALVEFAMHEGGRYAAVLFSGNAQVRAMDLGAVSQIDAAVSTFLEQVRHLQRIDDDQLFRLVLGPVLRAAGPNLKHLYVSPHGKLAGLPLAMLQQDGRRQESLVLDLDVTISYLGLGAHLLSSLRPQSAAEAPKPVAILRDSALTGATEEGLASTGLPPARSSSAAVLVKGRAQDAAALSQSSFQLLHLQASCDPSEVAAMELQGTQLVMCAYPVPEPLSMALALKAAGASSAVLSTLAGSEALAPDLLRGFYNRALHRNLAIPEALKAAQRELRASGAPRLAWGGFLAYGSAQQLQLLEEELEWAMSVRADIANGVAGSEKVARPGALESLVREALCTAFLWKKAQERPELPIYVPVLKAARRARCAEGQFGLGLCFSAVLDLRRRLDADELLRVAHALCCTLAAAARLGLVHGDLRPEQVLWREDGCPMLCGFGSAIDLSGWSADDPHKLLDDQVAIEAWARSRWSAPEASSGDLIGSTRRDIYSWALLVRHYAAGDLGGRLAAVVRRCLCEAPEMRPASFEDIREELRTELPQSEQLPFPRPQQAPARQHSVVTEAFELASKTEPMLRSDPQAVAKFRKLCHLLARSQVVVGTNQAESAAKRSLELAVQVHRTFNTPEVAETRHLLGLMHLRRGKLADAEKDLRESLRLHGATVGQASMTTSAHQCLAATFQALSSVLLRLGKLQDANDSASSALRTWEALHGDKAHPGSATSHYHLGILMLERGETHRAREEAQRSLEMAQAVYGEEHRATAASWHLLGSVLLKEGKPVEAEKAANRSLGIRRRLHSNQPHPDVAASLLLLGSVQDRGGKLDEAEGSLQQALDMMQRLRGTDADLEISSAYRRLGSLKLIRGRPEEAEQDLTRALDKSRAVHGDRPHPDTIAALHTLAVLHYTGNSYAEAKRFIRDAQEMQARLHGHGAADHPRTRDLRNLLAEVEAAESGKAQPPVLPGGSAPAAMPRPAAVPSAQAAALTAPAPSPAAPSAAPADLAATSAASVAALASQPTTGESDAVMEDMTSAAAATEKAVAAEVAKAQQLTGDFDFATELCGEWQAANEHGSLISGLYRRWQELQSAGSSEAAERAIRVACEVYEESPGCDSRGVVGSLLQRALGHTLAVLGRLSEAE